MSYPRLDMVDIGGRPPSRRRRLTRTLLIATAFTLPVAAWSAAGANPDPVAAANGSELAISAASLPAAAPHSYAALLDAVVPAVVTIRSEQRASRAAQPAPFSDHPLFREFFGDRIPRGGEDGQARQGLGSGVIVSGDGYILTNHHVIDGADRVTVELADRRTLTAQVVGTDAPSDLAVLKIDARNLPSVPLGNSDDVRVGDVVLAIGNPMGVGQTATMGIVSAKGRATGLGDGSFEDFIQTDASINRGNSGGALVSTRGQLVGINSQILSPSGGNIGIGFAIPSNMAKHVMDALVADGRVRRGMLGVTVQSLTSDLASSLGLTSARGALISAVADDGPAADAGLERGDVVTAIDGRPVLDSNDLRNRIAGGLPGNDVRLTVIRDGKERTMEATLDELPSRGAQLDRNDGSGESESLGLQVQPLESERARALGLERGTGLLVVSVRPGSPAADAGFRSGDVIEQVNRQSVASAEALREAVTSAGSRPVLVLVRRGEQSLFVTLTGRGD